MKDDTIIGLSVLEIDLLINILDEIVSSQKIPEVITEEIRQELFAELDIAKILTDLKNKLGGEKFLQLEDVDSGEVRLHIIKLSDWEIESLTNGDFTEVDPVIESILNQIKEEK